MDTTNKYIEMCKAKEIQSMWRPADGDFYVYLKHPNTSSLTVFKDSIFKDDKINLDNWIWLPRQDQLQDMLSDTVTIGYMIVGLEAFYDPERYCRKCSDVGERRRITYDTMEQWNLAFVMYEKFDKEWDVEKSEWIKEVLE